MRDRQLWNKETPEQGFVIERRTSPTGECFPLHWHDYYELEYIVSGSGRHFYNGVAHRVGAGDVYLMSYYDHHALKVERDIELIHINFEEVFLDPTLREILTAGNQSFRSVLGAWERECFLRCCERLLWEQKNENALKQTAQKALLSELLVLLIRSAGFAQISPPKAVQRAVAYIHRHFDEDISLALLAEQLDVSQNHLGLRFRENMGMTFHDYLNQVRLKYACGMLSASSRSIKEIALDCGYRSVEYFFFVFRKQLGTTPAQYRKANRRELS